MDIRGNLKTINKLKKIKTKVKDINFNIDDKIESCVIMLQTEEKKLVEWTRGYDNVSSFLKYGYVRITKMCPYRHRKCIGEKCSLYFIMNNTGDCVHIWNVIQN